VFSTNTEYGVSTTPTSALHKQENNSMIFKTINSSVDETRTNVLNRILSYFVILYYLIGLFYKNTNSCGEWIWQTNF